MLNSEHHDNQHIGLGVGIFQQMVGVESRDLPADGKFGSRDIPADNRCRKKGSSSRWEVRE